MDQNSVFEPRDTTAHLPTKRAIETADRKMLTATPGVSSCNITS